MGIRWRTIRLRRFGRTRTAIVGGLNLGGSGARLLVELILNRFRPDARLRGLWRWTLVHLYAFAPRRTLDRYR